MGRQEPQRTRLSVREACLIISVAGCAMPSRIWAVFQLTRLRLRSRLLTKFFDGGSLRSTRRRTVLQRGHL